MFYVIWRAQRLRPAPTSKLPLFCFIYFSRFLSDHCYPEIYWADFRQIFRVGRTMAADDQPEISF